MKNKRRRLQWSAAFMLAVLLALGSMDLSMLTAYAENDTDTTNINVEEPHTVHTPDCGYAKAVTGKPCTHEHDNSCYVADCIHEHDAACGYVEAMEGTPCGHVHDADCGYAEAVEEVLCGCTDTDENGSIIHTEGCGYVKAVAGSPCTHTHNEACGYMEDAEGAACTHVCSLESGCYRLVCSHAEAGQHDDTCGYVEATEGSPCKYEGGKDNGEEENAGNTENPAPVSIMEEVQAMIDALPEVSELEGMSDEELSEVHNKAQEAYEVYKSLTEEEQAELLEVVEKLSSIMEWMNTNFIQSVDMGTDMNTSCTEHTYNDDGFCSVCGDYQEAEQNSNGYYEISNAGQLYWFAEFVNAGNNTANAVLTADIDLENGPWTPIGRYSDSKLDSDNNIIYKGTFDGQCHVICNLKIKVTSTCETGLFSRTETATLKNFGVISAEVENTQGICSGVIAGTIKNSTVENVFTAGAVEEEASGIEEITISTSDNQAGGIAGKIIEGGLKYSFTTYSTLCGTAEDVETNQITNCYYLADEANENSIGENKDDWCFECGELAWKLNGDSSEGVWKENFLTDLYPNFSGLTVYYDEDENRYCNYKGETLSVQISWTEMEFTYTDGEWNPEVHNYGEGSWTASEDGAGVITVKNIGNIDALVLFAYTGTEKESGISGSPTLTRKVIKVGGSCTTTLELKGKPSERMDKAELGSITVTVKRADDE